MKTNHSLFLLFAWILTMASCAWYPSDADLLTETDVVLTMYDVNTNFNDFKTFSIVDSIGVVQDNDTTVKRISNDTTTAVLNQIKQNMIQRGFTKVAKSANPDFAINVVVIKTLNVAGNYYPGYWWGYPGYYPPEYWYNDWYGWSYYYPWYPVYYYTYYTGTLVIDMVDAKDPDPNTKKLKIVFNTYIRGILNGTRSLNDILKDIDQAYIQTPQLKTSN
ncbi:MAG: DUF4136 domain-containing protein [bacterium]